jgi:hypothetical protein
MISEAFKAGEPILMMLFDIIFLRESKSGTGTTYHTYYTI